MAALHHYLLPETDTPDPTMDLADIRDARLQVEAEARAQLDEQARWRLAAQTRAVPVEQLLPSRAADLQRLEEEQRQAERDAIAAIERRMEVALRAIEADNARILEEERVGLMAAERMALAQQAMQRARERQAVELQLTEQIRQRHAQEQQAEVAARERMAAEQTLQQLASERQARDADHLLALLEAQHETQWALRALDWADERKQWVRRQRGLWGALLLTWLVAGMVLWRIHGVPL